MEAAKSVEQNVYRAGTLTYTRPALVVLFFWLLWGDFCYMLMEHVTPSIMPLRFKALGATNTEMGLILGTIPGLVYSLLNPVISFKSDRYRSKWGRRIPFILGSVPFLVVCLVMLAFGDQVGFWIHSKLGATSVSANRVAVWTFGAFLVVFTFFNTFVTSVFWYLFNDVVPEHLLARFMSWFRIISMGAGALYNFCIFRFAGTHAMEIFIGAAILYGAGFTLMCLNVKEGRYPAPSPYVGGRVGPLAAIQTYGRDCHSHRHYWYLWVATFIGSVGAGISVFTLLFQMAIGLDTTHIGYINGTSSIVVGVLILGSGWLADKYHPIRVVLAACIFNLAVVLPANMVWIFWHPGPDTAFWVAFAIAVGLGAPMGALMGVWDPPMLMRLFPRDRYGQFCSTNAVWRAMGGIIGGGIAGAYLDLVTRFAGKERAYFFIPVWQLFFAIPAFIVLLKLYGSWKRHGGDNNYRPPIPDPGPPG